MTTPVTSNALLIALVVYALSRASGTVDAEDHSVCPLTARSVDVASTCKGRPSSDQMCSEDADLPTCALAGAVVVRMQRSVGSPSVVDGRGDGSARGDLPVDVLQALV